MADRVKAVVTAVIDPSKRSGAKQKPDGTVYQWNIMTVKTKTEFGKEVIADSFNPLKVGDKVNLEYDQKYDTTNAFLHKDSPMQDAIDRIEKKVNAIAEMVGVPSDTTGTAPQVMDSIPKEVNEAFNVADELKNLGI